jgi:hypothetical protein
MNAAFQYNLKRRFSKEKGKTKGYAVCAHCGGEADIWLDV